MSSLGVSVSHQQARDGLFLTVAAVSPFVLRTFGDWLISKILDKCCKMTKKELAAHLIGKGESEMTINNVINNTLSWTEAKEDLGLNQCAAMTIATIRLLFWHWMQPLLYWFVLYAYWDLLDPAQRVTGSIVGGRECIYFLLTVVALCCKPVYLLVDLRSSWKEHDDWVERMNFMGMYVIAPEKYVAAAIGGNSDQIPETLLNCFILCLLPLLDMAGVAAFVSAFVADKVYAPLIIGYTVTTMGGLFFLTMLLIVCCIAHC